MKRLVVILFFAVACLPLCGQTGYKPIGAAGQKELAAKIAAASQGMKTLRCDFTQEKTISILSEKMLSEGTMCYKQPDKLLWQYTKPYRYTFVLNGGKVMMDSGSGKSVVDVNASKLMREVSRIIIAGTSGAGIFQEERFTAVCTASAKDYCVTLTPKQKELRGMFAAIKLYVNGTDYTVERVEIEEASGDRTVIRMRNKQLNTPLSDAIFAIQ